MGHPDEVEEIFDAISYEKGASVIRMLFDYLGEDVGSSFCIMGKNGSESVSAGFPCWSCQIS